MTPTAAPTVPGRRAAIRVTRAWWSEWPRLDAATKDRMVADGLVIFE